MTRKIVYILISIIVLTAMLFSTSAAFAVEDDNGFTMLKNGDTGDDVILVQFRLRDLGYFNYKITNYFGPYTTETLAEFQKENGLGADGVLGPETYEVLFSNTAKRKPVEQRVKPAPKATSSSTRYGELKDWFSYVLPRFDRGEKVKVTDLETGISFYMVRTGGSNHADSEPASSSDTKKIKEIYGGEWSWERRAMVVRLDGHYIAASMHGFPHAYDMISGNGMAGHLCIHFLNSKTHIRDAKDPEHQAMVQAASGN